MDSVKCSECGMPITGNGDVKCPQCNSDMTCTDEGCTCTKCGNTIQASDIKCPDCRGPR